MFLAAAQNAASSMPDLSGLSDLISNPSGLIVGVLVVIAVLAIIRDYDRQEEEDEDRRRYGRRRRHEDDYEYDD